MHHLGGDAVGATAWYVLGVLLLAAALNVSGRADVDVVGALVWLALALGRVLPLPNLLAGFGSEAVLLVGSMMAVAEGLRRTGLTGRLGSWLIRHAGRSPLRARILAVLAGAGLTSVLESTAATISLIPMVAALARHGRVRPQHLYLLGALGVMAGSTLTLVGTSGNVVANGVLQGMGLRPMGMLTLLPIGVAMVGLCVVYAVVAGRLLPRPQGTDLTGALEALRSYLGEMRVLPGSPLVGRTLRESGLRAEYGVDVLAVERAGLRQEDPGPDRVLGEGDLLLVAGSADGIAGLAATSEPPAALRPTAEGLLPPGSDWVGATLASLRVRAVGMHVLGIWRHGQTLSGRLANLRLEAGDVLLSRGDRDLLQQLQAEGHIAWLNAVEPGDVVGRRPWLALAVLAAFVAVTATGSLDLAVAALAAAAVLVLGGALRARDGYDAVQWRVLVLLAGVVPLGEAVSRSGLGAVLATWLGALGQHWGPEAALAGLAATTALCTQILSNVSTAAVMTPVGVVLARSSHLSVEAAVATLLVAAVATPVTPIASKPAILVRGPGGYGLKDYLRLGLPFAVLALTLAVWLSPRIWPA